MYYKELNIYVDFHDVHNTVITISNFSDHKRITKKHDLTLMKLSECIDYTLKEYKQILLTNSNTKNNEQTN